MMACALASGALLLAYGRDRRPAYLYAKAVVDALCLLTDPRVVGFVIVLGIAWAIERYGFKRNLFDLGSLRSEAKIPWKRLGMVCIENPLELLQGHLTRIPRAVVRRPLAEDARQAEVPDPLAGMALA